MSAGTLAPYAFPQAFDDNGDPLDGGLLYTYASGTSTPAVTWTDGDLLVPNTNPIVLTTGGRYQIYLGPTSYKFILKNAAGVVVDTTDPVGSLGLITSGVVTEFSFFGDSTSPITSTTYPSGSTFAACHAGTAIFSVDSASLATGAYVLKGMIASVTGDIVSAAFVNLSDGAPDTPIATMSSSSTTGASVTSGVIAFAAPGTPKNYGIKTKVSAGAGFAWAFQLVKQS